MLLTNHKTGASANFHIRPIRLDDIPDAIACVRDAYQDTYVKPYLYTGEGFLKHIENGGLCFSVAEAEDGRLAGIIAHEVSGFFPGLAEIACEIILHEFSGYGLAAPLALYQLSRIEPGPYKGYFARALGCHKISQKTLSIMGFTHCGFLLSVFDRDKLLTHYHKNENPKISQAVSVKRGTKRDAGILYIPGRLAPLAETLYRSLGRTYKLSDDVPSAPAESIIALEDDTTHNTLLIRAAQVGAGFGMELAALVNSVAGRPLQTVNLLLNMNDPGSVKAYRAAGEQGFLFTGFLPGMSDGEYIILHDPLDVPFDVDKIPYIPEFEPYAAEIRRQQHE